LAPFVNLTALRSWLADANDALRRATHFGRGHGSGEARYQRKQERKQPRCGSALHLGNEYVTSLRRTTVDAGVITHYDTT